MNKENIRNIEFINSTIIDRITMISNEYSVSFDTLVNLAVKRLLEDIEFVRDLRAEKVELE